ncbi:DDE superfamily endonuclease [Phytophthora infestans]|uniref:DDE superfamily endonuclease n=1 Tax=Phytophthora infestans TaxID=4787 RepID=A0A833SUY4_PHYIN|nr:DDE superfamily endonuclease [Phytophthora infestans]
MPVGVPDDFKQRNPYFDQALCAIDGSHFHVLVPSEDVKRFRNHKGYVSTNALIACDWNLNVCFAYVGAEGSAHDAMVLQWSKFLDLVPDHFYVLADAGYGLNKKVLTPYRGVRYHLKEWSKASGRPKNGKELFNLRHSKARNVVERVIGVLKRRFKILRTCMDFEFFNIKAAVFACLCVHNFIRKFDETDLGEDFQSIGQGDQLHQPVDQDDEPISFDFQSGASWRDWMSSTMWEEYEGMQTSIGDESEEDLFSVDGSEIDNRSVINDDVESSGDDSELESLNSSEPIRNSGDMSDSSWLTDSDESLSTISSDEEM